MKCIACGFCLFVVIQISTTIVGESPYSIIAPGTIRSNRKYSVGVTLHQAAAPATIRIAITSPTTSMNLSQDVTLQPHETKLIDFMAPRLLSRFNYELKAEGVQGIVLNEKSSLYAITYGGGPNIFVESDRGIYKPEDTVHFRVIILDENLRPVNIVEPIRIQILDADKNRVKQFKDIQLNRGVLAEKFILSKQPILGEWTILIHLSGKYNLDREYKFQVEEYVLPKFSVHIDTDPNFVERDRFIKAKVYAKYTHGKYVEGTVDVYLMDDYERNLDRAIKQTVVIGNGAIKADVALDFGGLYSSKLLVHAVFKEHLTNIIATGETKVKRQYNRYNIIVPEEGIEFRDNQPYRLKVQVHYWNGTIVKDTSTPIAMNLKKNKYKSYMDSDGIAQFEFEFEPESDFRISYGDSVTVVNNIYAPRVSYDYELQTCKINMKGLSSVDFKLPLEFEVSSNETIPYLIYTIVSHGNIIRDEYVQMPPNQKSHKIYMNISIDIIPQSYLYVHYIVNKQLRYCEFTIRLPEKFENEISITAPTSVKPGQEITMNIKGQPNSHVSIVAVDKSVLLLKSDNVLQKSLIMRTLLYDRSYLQGTGTIYYPGYVSGLITLTNAKFDVRDMGQRHEAMPQLTTEVYPRSVFPETWIFEDLELDGTGASLKLKVPDTITTWIVRAISVNDYNGFGMIDTTLDIQAFKPFFISTNLPYSVKRGEVVTIPITVFNYLQQNYETDVFLDNTKQEFTLMDSQNKPVSKTSDCRNVNIPANNGKSVAFVIKPKMVGDIEIRITAKNRETSDTIIQKLKVVPEGIKRQYNLDKSLNLIHGKSQQATFHAQIPPNIVAGSEYVVLSVSGDIMVSTLENLENLVLKPFGCGEQNMINFAPNILILDYLKALNKFTNLTELVARAKQYIETGYQQELTYRHREGGYSVFGPNGSSKESNWLTAYVTRFFIKGMKYSAIEPRIIESGLEYLAKQQATNGSFPQRGYLFHPSHQSQYGFTAFVLMAYLDDPKYSTKYSTVLEKGMQFLTNNLNSINDAYSLAIVANVFQTTANSHANEILRKLKEMARMENGLMWWTSNAKNKESANCVEITSYALMALLETSGHYASVFNWLLKQRNSHGGFGSTQDTVVGLQALIKYAEKSSHGSSEETQLKVHYVAKDERGENVKEHILGVDTENQLILQQQELPSTARSVDVEVMGQGKIFLQFAYQYYTSISSDGKQLAANSIFPTPRFTDAPSGNRQSAFHTMALTERPFFIIKPTAKLSSTAKSLSLVICCSYQPLTSEESLTNMVILQVQLPSSFVSNAENVAKLKEEEQISRVELQNSSTMLVIYFEKLEANNEQCLIIIGDKLHEVTSLKPSLIEMYDYYNPNERGEILYEINT